MSHEFTKEMFQCIKGMKYDIEGYTYTIRDFSESYDIPKIRLESTHFSGNFREYGVNMFMFLIQNASETHRKGNVPIFKKLQEEFPERFI